MGGLILRRVGVSLLSLVIVSLVLFVLTRSLPDSPARIVLGFDATAAQVTQFEHDNGLDRPVLWQYGSWIGKLVLHGDLDRSYVTRLPVAEQLRQTLPATLELVAVAFTFAAAASLVLGTISALRRGGVIDHLARLLAVIGVSVPGFWLALLLIYLLAVDREWFPPGGFVPLAAGLWEHLNALVLPSFCLGVFYVAVLSRMTRSALLEVMEQDYMRTARATGLGRVRLLYYALRNALPPVVTVGAMSFGYMFGWALVIETVFNINGMSHALLTAIRQRDFVMVQAVVMLFTVIFMLSNLAADLANAWLNPMLRSAR